MTDLLVRFRVLLGFLVGGVCLVCAKPVSPFFWTLGMILVLFGAGLRLVATGYLKKSKTLTCSGPYAHFRSPLYVGSFLMAGGFCWAVSDPALPGKSVAFWIVFLGFFTILYSAKIRAEEKNLETIFGEEWRQYCRAVPRFFPRITAYRCPAPWGFSWECFKKNGELKTTAGVLVIVLYTWLRLNNYF